MAEKGPCQPGEARPAKGLSFTEYPAGTSNSWGTGSRRLMLVNRYVVSPARGSMCVVITSTLSSGETHSSETTVIGCS